MQSPLGGTVKSNCERILPVVGGTMLPEERAFRQIVPTPAKSGPLTIDVDNGSLSAQYRPA